MVGGLVQNQEVHLLIHEHAQPQTALLPAGEHGDGLKHILPLEQEFPQTVPGLLGIAPRLIEHGVVEAALRVGKSNLLGQVTHLYGEPLLHRATVLGLLPQNDLQQGGLSRPIVPQQGDAVPILHPEGHMVKENLAAEGLIHLPQGQEIVGVKLRLAKLGL